MAEHTYQADRHSVIIALTCHDRNADFIVRHLHISAIIIFYGPAGSGQNRGKRERKFKTEEREGMSVSKSTHLEIRPYSAEILRHGYYALVIQFRYARSNYYTFGGALSELYS